jgi:hypothetical protein
MTDVRDLLEELAESGPRTGGGVLFERAASGARTRRRVRRGAQFAATTLVLVAGVATVLAFRHSPSSERISTAGGNTATTSAVPASSTGTCPASVTTAQVAGSTLSPTPDGVRLCGYDNGALVPSSSASVWQGRAEAQHLARLLLATPVDDALGQQCADRKPSVLLRFAVANSVVDVPVVDCSKSIAYVDGRGHVLDKSTHADLSASAKTSQVPRLVVPDLVGNTFDAARATAHQAHFVLRVTGQQVSTTSPEGVVLRQSPAAGAQDSSSGEIDVVVSVGPAPAPCVASNLAADYRNTGGATGTHLAAIVIRNVGSSRCQLTAPVSVVGINASRVPVTTRVSFTVEPSVILTPTAVGAPKAVVANVVLGARPLDGAGGSNCPRSVTPELWKLSIGGGTLTVRNHDNVTTDPLGTAGLSSCNGTFTAEGSVTAAS